MLPIGPLKMRKQGGAGYKAARIYSDANGYGTAGTRLSLSGIQFQDAAGNPISTAGATLFEGGGTFNSAISNAFDGAPATGNPWSRTGTAAGANVYGGAIFATPQPVAKVRMWSGNWGQSFNEAPIQGRLQVSNDTTNGTDGTWTDLFTFWEPSWADATQSDRTHPQDTTGGKFKAFAWFPTLSNDGAHMAMDEAELFTGGGSVDVVNPADWHSISSPGVSNPLNLADNVTTNWTELGATNRFTGIALPDTILLTGYSLGKYQWLTEAWKNWTLKGTNDGSSFTLLDTRINQSWPVAGKTSYGPI